ncbi:MAG: SPOR domain-containing protein [Bacteroidales bacterium]
MRNNIILLIILSLSVASCKTTESNYREAYLKAINTTAEEQENNSIESQIEQKRITPVITENNNNEIVIKREFVTVVDGERSLLNNYNVVVAEFTQMFNAKSFRDRLTSQHQTSSYVLKNNKNKYFTIINGFNTRNEAIEYIQKLESENKIQLPIAKAWIIYAIK